jgi:hypothetical protein
MVMVASFFSALVLYTTKAAYHGHVIEINAEDLVIFG